MSALALSWGSGQATNPMALAGEDVALVRPYLLAWERRVRPRTVVVAPYLSSDAWSALVGVR
ncbi:hypothetical protein [Streptomyces fuscigenes]|uniref:hypothetical protein n=1 Tax=Streptomyces fuscigenes TaxID=1528880 RepID=UPI001F2ED4D8|nr:hypothetical protein [Streptomyces fuscigenes]MCF3960813.1 hypothetical protein [Streptomyces fuscigenes]